MEQKILNQRNEYKNGKRIYVQTMQETRSKGDDYAQMAEFYATIAQYERLLEKSNDPKQMDTWKEEIKAIGDAIVLLQEYIRGYDDGIEQV